MSSKKNTFTEGNTRPPSLVGRGTTTVKRDAFSEGINRNVKIERRTETRKSNK
ncbi:hypothetical protein [Sutcliffiella halmapala]|uniref:hypothetical protein n=1 Tax=Sutcliffiella halmapala TaxID=79882 RepID=UPI0014727592|nr:hypothetical protein [Sutcliffiella halmapala]